MNPKDRNHKIIVIGLLIVVMLIGILLGYYIGVNISENFYLPQLEHCVVLPLENV